MRGHLIAWDPVRGRKVWDVEHPAAWKFAALSPLEGAPGVEQADVGIGETWLGAKA